MRHDLKVYSADRLLDIVGIEWIETKQGIATYRIQNEDLPSMPQQDEATTRRRRRNRKLLQRVADPEAGFPILRSLIQRFAPILIEYLMKQLPIWLADVKDLERDEQTA